MSYSQNPFVKRGVFGHPVKGKTMYEFMGILITENLDEILDIIWDYLDILDSLEEEKR